MAKVMATFRHAGLDVELSVLNYNKDETPENREAIVDLDLGFNFPGAITPRSLKGLGEWLIKKSEQISINYTPTGNPKQLKEG